MCRTCDCSARPWQSDPARLRDPLPRSLPGQNWPSLSQRTSPCISWPRTGASWRCAAAAPVHEHMPWSSRLRVSHQPTQFPLALPTGMERQAHPASAGGGIAAAMARRMPDNLTRGCQLLSARSGYCLCRRLTAAGLCGIACKSLPAAPIS